MYSTHRPTADFSFNSASSSGDLTKSGALYVEPPIPPRGSTAAGDTLQHSPSDVSSVASQRSSLSGTLSFGSLTQPSTTVSSSLDLTTQATGDAKADDTDSNPLDLHIQETFGGHRYHPCAAILMDPPAVRQTILRGPPSRAPASVHSALSTTGHANHGETTGIDDSTRLSETLCDLKDMRLDGPSLATAKLAALASPCFFHKRFVDAVDFERVLEEIQGDEGMSHSKLMQTAHGVREVARQLQRRPIKRAVKTVLIVTKARDNELVLLTRELTEWLLSTPRYGSEVGVNVYVDAKLRRSNRFGADELTSRDPRYESMLRYWTPDLCWDTPEKFDLVLTLGGDGTVLYTSWLFQRIVPPILSFSLGSLGFLTNFEYADFRKNLDSIMGDGGMRVNLRMRFTCTVYRANQLNRGSHTDSVEVEKFEVLNELVIDRGPSPYVSNLELYGDGNLLTVVQADGCIFSTPTGSTAYSLSAGGALVHPDIPAILLTPICPHTLSFRPMLLNDTMSLRVVVPKSSRGGAWCSFDGKGRVELHPGDAVSIAASQYPFPTVLSNQMEWFDSISRTLRWNTRGATQKAWNARTGEEEAGQQAEAEQREDDFDIDFDDPDESAARDSGYSGTETSSVQDGASPIRKVSNALAY